MVASGENIIRTKSNKNYFVFSEEEKKKEKTLSKFGRQLIILLDSCKISMVALAQSVQIQPV